MSEAVLAAIIGAVSSGLAGLIGRVIQHRRTIFRLRQRMDALVAAALEMAMREGKGMEEGPVPFIQVADALLANELVTPEDHGELLALWEVRKRSVSDPGGSSLTLKDARALLSRTDKLIGTLEDTSRLHPGDQAPPEDEEIMGQAAEIG